MKQKPQSRKNLPRCDEELGVRIDVLMDLFFKNLMVFASFLNDEKYKSKDIEFAEFIVFCMGKKLEELKSSKKGEKNGSN